jgi:hypothetical protein
MLPTTNAAAQDIYRCEIDGKISYRANEANGAGCRLVKFMNTNPSDEEVGRVLQEKARQEAEDEAAAAEARENARLEAERRSAQALEQQAGAALRRADAAEEQLKSMKEAQRNAGYPAYGGIYYGGRRRLHFGESSMPSGKHLDLPSTMPQQTGKIVIGNPHRTADSLESSQ